MEFLSLVDDDDKDEHERTVAVDEGRWIKHYCSRHRILVVGDGDFSFSACLAHAFGSAPNMVATSLDSQEFLVENYGNAATNIQMLRRRECLVVHEVDATKMQYHPLLGHVKYDRIIFNFPFAGFFRGLPRQAQLELHRNFVSLFLENSKRMIGENGEIHITHKTNGFHSEWNLESLASLEGLSPIDAVDFDVVEYPVYHTKRGFGGDEDFDCYPSKTFKFGFLL